MIDLVPYLPNLRRYARTLTRDPATAEDLVQTTCLRALEKQHLYMPGTNLRAWLFTLMHNTRVNAVRRAMREGAQVGEAILENRASYLSDPEVNRELAEVINALKRLPRVQQRIIVAAALTDDSYEELGAFEAVPIGTVRSRLSRARAALRLLGRGAAMSQQDLELLG